MLLERRFSVDDLNKCTVSEFFDTSATRAYVLVNVGVSTARPSDAHTDMVLCEVVARQLTAVLVESGRKHHVAVVSILINVFKLLAHESQWFWQAFTSSRHDLSKIGLPVGLQELICLVNDSVPDAMLVTGYSKLQKPT